MSVIISWVVYAIAIYATAYLLPGITVDGFMGALWVAVGLGIINAVIRPIVMFFTLPLNFLTLGLLSFVINALMVMLAGAVLAPSFVVENFWWALLFSLVLSVINGLLGSLIGKKK